METAPPSYKPARAEPVPLMEGLTSNQERVTTRIRTPEGPTLINEGRESAGMRRVDSEHFTLVIRTVSGYYVEVTMTREAFAEHRDRISRMLL